MLVGPRNGGLHFQSRASTRVGIFLLYNVFPFYSHEKGGRFARVEVKIERNEVSEDSEGS